jgi:hypothetical protein
MKPGRDPQSASEAGGAARAQIECELPSPPDEQVVNAFDVFGSDLPDTAFDGIFERMSENAVRSRAPKDA